MIASLVNPRKSFQLFKFALAVVTCKKDFCITADGDLISINSECSPWNETMSDEDIRLLDLGNSSETISFNLS